MNRSTCFKYLNPIFLFLLLSIFTTKAQITDLMYPSKLNNQDIPVKVYLPPGYATSTERLPVVYDLHGGGGTPERQWDRTRKTLIDAVENKRIRPLIYVYANGLGNTIFVNTKDGKQIEKSIVEELIPFIDQKFRTIASREGRAIEGFSMGGFGSLVIAFRHPELFSSVVSYGAALVIKGTDPNFRDEAHYQEFSPWLSTVRNKQQILKNMRIRMVCGDSDWLYYDNIKFKNHLDSLRIPVDWVSIPGVAHCTQCLYEKVGLESLKFIEQSFELASGDHKMNEPVKRKKPMSASATGAVKGLNGEPAPFRPSGALPRLRVSDNKRFLVTEAGNPFFWLGDTGWRLFQSLDREEVDKYFENRAAQQFSIVLAHILPWEQGETNTYGEPAFVNNDFNKPNEKYWKHADYIVEQASAKGLYLGLLPMWCLNYIERKNGPSLIDAPAAYAYGKFLSKRYGDKTHLVWILGGDAPPAKHDIYDALAKGITDGTGGEPDKVLISYHPPSRLKSTGAFYHDRPWLDFNMLQSGHDIWRLSYETTAEDYARRPVKPTVDAEPNYENHPIRHKFENGVFTAYHMRMKAYWGVFAGGFGFTYGGNGIWQMDKAGKEPFLKTHANLSWDKAIDLPGAQQMKYLRQLMESRPFLSRVPDKNIMLLSPAGEKEARIEATYGQDRSWAMFYLTTGQPLRVNLANMKAKKINAWWFNPRDGKTYDNDGKVTTKPFNQFKKSTGKGSFDPPGNTGDENDWILVLDDAAKHYPVPGLSASR